MLRTTQIGFVGGAPEMRYVPSGDAVTSMRVGTTDRWKGGDGEVRERTTWLTWECWGKSAENLARLVSKGAQVLVEGSIRNESWQDKDGNTHYRDKYVVQQWRLLDRKPRDSKDADSGGEVGGVGATPDDDGIPF